MRPAVALVLSALAVFASAPVAASADAPLVVPIAYHNHDCRASVLVLSDEGGCASFLDGTLTVACDATACDVALDVRATGVRASSTPQGTDVMVRAVAEVWHQDGAEPGYLEGYGHDCEARASAQTVTCDLRLARRVAHSPLLDHDFERAERHGCVNVFLDGVSRTQLPGGIASTHTASSRGVGENDTRPLAPMWYVCWDGEGTYAVESTFRHTGI